MLVFQQRLLSPPANDARKISDFVIYPDFLSTFITLMNLFLVLMDRLQMKIMSTLHQDRLKDIFGVANYTIKPF